MIKNSTANNKLGFTRGLHRSTEVLNKKKLQHLTGSQHMDDKRFPITVTETFNAFQIVQFYSTNFKVTTYHLFL